VDPRWQGRGVARSLMSFALTTAVRLSKEIGCLCVMTHPLDDGVRALYRSFGFEDLPFDLARSMAVTDTTDQRSRECRAEDARDADLAGRRRRSDRADFLLDTPAVISMARAGRLQRYPRLKIILSHAGGFLHRRRFRPIARISIASMPAPADCSLGVVAGVPSTASAVLLLGRSCRFGCLSFVDGMRGAFRHGRRAGRSTQPE
jgi:predicted GNAT family acetyltransferase